MTITDEMVEAGARAAYDADIADLKAESDMWLTWEEIAKTAPTTAAARYRTMSRACLEAALGAQEPPKTP